MKKIEKQKIEYFKKNYKPNGILRDPVDDRDLTISKIKTLNAEYPPIVESASWKKLRVKNQQRTNSCAGQSGDTAIEDIEFRNGRGELDFSPLWIYYNARKLSGLQDRDAGCYLRDVCKVLCNQGIALEEHWPFDASKVLTAPSAISNFFAGLFKQDSYYRCYTVEDIMEALTKGYSVMIGTAVFESYYKATGGDFTVKLPADGEQNYGGHAVSCQMVDRLNTRVGVQGSWGTGFGNGGFYYLSYEFLVKYGYDIWAVKPKRINWITKTMRKIFGK